LGKFIPKTPILAILGAVLPHFLTHSDEIWHEGANLGLPAQNHFVKNRYAKGVDHFWANLYQKLPISAILGVVSPHFKSDNGEIWPDSTDLGYPSALNFVKVARGDLYLGEIFTKNSKFSLYLTILEPLFLYRQEAQLVLG